MSDDEYENPSYFNCDNVSERCPVELTIYGDYFTQGACIFFVVAYGINLIAQGYFGWRLKSWGFVSCLAAGAILEFMGYVGRTVLSENPWNFGAFVIQNLMLVLGPTIVAAAISVTFKHLVIWYGSQWSLIRPKLYPWVFVGTDVVSLLVQMAGGGVAAMATGDTDPAMMNLGNNLMLAGVAFQLVNMVFCGGLILTYAWRRRQNKTKVVFDSTQQGSDASETVDTAARYATSDDAAKVRTKRFVWALAVAYLAIIFRCIYRIPEMAMGWGSSLQKNETTFLILDGAMILSSVTLLTVFHPATFFPFMGKVFREGGRQEVVEEPMVATERK
ncbi:RTA1-like protein [Plectosphaerella plurivora]|uniref:RTA1-like protein n=1 Tax=Plectosphaerella plurivora TaxID=936078 RepID=A0A9P8V0C6_9PEZI|nr:RTA1-like protein [Plectosphaerella plurivora]